MAYRSLWDKSQQEVSQQEIRLLALLLPRLVEQATWHSQCYVFRRANSIVDLKNSFLQMVSVAAAGGSVINYSDRFTLTGMTGTFSTAEKTANDAVTSDAGPDTVNGVTDTTATTTTAAGAWGTPYDEQTGLTRYAPMQPLPGTTITATNTVPLWPTSSVSIATTYLPNPSIVTTLTQAGTYSFSSHANTVSMKGTSQCTC